MAQPQPIQRPFFVPFLEQVPELQPEVIQSGPGIGSEDPEPPSIDSFQPNDSY